MTDKSQAELVFIEKAITWLKSYQTEITMYPYAKAFAVNLQSRLNTIADIRVDTTKKYRIGSESKVYTLSEMQAEMARRKSI